MRRLIAAAAVLIGLSASFAAPGAIASGTEVVRYTPFAWDGDVRDDLAVAPRYGGDCWTGSFVVHRGFRCMSGNRIYDPCWEDTRTLAPVVVCVLSPDSEIAYRLRVSGEMNNDYSANPGTIWAMRLRGAGMCTFVQGASAVARGKRLNYFCDNEGAVFGNARRRGRFWSVSYADNASGDGWRRVRVRRAFVGRG